MTFRFNDHRQVIALFGRLKAHYHIVGHGPSVWDDIADHVGAETIIAANIVIGLRFHTEEAYMEFQLKWL